MDQPSPLTAPNLGGLLDAARQQLDAQDRVIVEVQIDGETLTGDDIAARAHVPIVAVDIALHTAAPAQIAGDALTHIQSLLDEARQLQADAADDLQADHSQPAFEKLAALIDRWLQVQQGVADVAQFTGLELANLDAAGTPMPEVSAELLNQLHALKEAIESSDGVTLADALAYEWPAQVDRWDAVVAAIRAAVA